MADWEQLQQRAAERYEDGERRLPDDPDARQRQLTRMGNAAGAAGLAALMAGGDGVEWFERAATRYRESWADAPEGSWGRPIGAIKARILAGDWDGAADDARWAIDAGAAGSESPIGRYAAALAYAVLGEWDDVRVLRRGHTCRLANQMSHRTQRTLRLEHRGQRGDMSVCLRSCSEDRKRHRPRPGPQPGRDGSHRHRGCTQCRERRPVQGGDQAQ